MRIALALIFFALASPLSARTIKTGPYFLSFEPNTATLTEESASAPALIKGSLSLMDEHSVYICSLTATGRLADARVWEVVEALGKTGVKSQKIWPGGECPPEISGRRGEQIPPESVFVLLGTDEKLEAVVEEAESKRDGILTALNEPSFLAQDALYGYLERYRLIVSPSFDAVTSIRVDIELSGRSTAEVTQLDGRGGYSPGTVAAKSWIPVAKASVDTLRAKFRQADFQNQPSEEPISEITDEAGNKRVVICGDGTGYVIERISAQGHHSIIRSFCTTRDQSIVDIIEEFFRRAPDDLPVPLEPIPVR